MHRFTWPLVVVVVSLAIAASVGVASATAGGGNSANAKLCQKGGWMNLVRSDETTFANQGACVSYGAKGGTLMPKATCTAGSENFSEDAEFSRPTTFAGGTIDTAFVGTGSIRVQGSSYFGWNVNGAHILYAGEGGSSMKLTFTSPVGSVQLNAQTDAQPFPPDTLTAYDASNSVVGTDTENSGFGVVNTLSVSSTSNNIKYFTVSTQAAFGISFSNIVWGCAA